MNKAIYNGNVIEYEDDISVLSIDRFMKYNYLLKVDADLGSDLNSINEKFAPLHAMLDKKDTDNAKIALINMQQNLALIQQGMHPKFMAFSALVYRINGKERDDFSDDGLKQTHDMMGKYSISWSTIKFLIDQVKKKIEAQTEAYFPDLESKTVSDFYMNLKMKARFDLSYILGEEVNEFEEQRVDEFFYSLLKPTVFWGKDGYEVDYFKKFEITCNLMRGEGVPEPKKLSVREFYQYLADLTKKYKPKKKGAR